MFNGLDYILIITNGLTDHVIFVTDDGAKSRSYSLIYIIYGSDRIFMSRHSSPTPLPPLRYREGDGGHSPGRLRPRSGCCHCVIGHIVAAVVAAENADLECCIGENDSSLQPKQQILHRQSHC